MNNKITKKTINRTEFIKKLKLSDKAFAEINRICNLETIAGKLSDDISEYIEEENKKLNDFKGEKEEIKYPGILFLDVQMANESI
jgi:hypothetical protein